MKHDIPAIIKVVLVLILVAGAVALFVTSLPAFKMPSEYSFNDTIQTDVTIIVPDSLKSVNYFINSDYNHIDSIKVENGVAHSILSTPNFAFVSLFVKDQILAVVIADGKEIRYDLTDKNMNASYLNNVFYEARRSEEELFIKPLNELYEKYLNSHEDSIMERNAIEKKINEIDERYSDYIQSYAKNNLKNILPAYAISQAYYTYNYEKLSQLLDSNAVYTSHPILDQAKMHLGGLYKRRNGIMYTDMTMKDTEGNEVSLSQWAGQGTYVFVDFWASWCSPCRGELPNILEVYDKYHNKEGFDVVGVSVDSNRDSWVKCIDKFGLPWHHMSELSGRGGLTKDLYGVGAIPCSVLLDPKGYIVASDLRGEQLMETLKNIYGY